MKQKILIQNTNLLSKICKYLKLSSLYTPKPLSRQLIEFKISPPQCFKTIESKSINHVNSFPLTYSKLLNPMTSSNSKAANQNDPRFFTQRQPKSIPGFNWQTTQTKIAFRKPPENPNPHRSWPPSFTWPSVVAVARSSRPRYSPEQSNLSLKMVFLEGKASSKETCYNSESTIALDLAVYQYVPTA